MISGPQFKTSFLMIYTSNKNKISSYKAYLVKNNNFKSLSTVKEGGEREKMCDNGLRSAVADMSAGG